MQIVLWIFAIIGFITSLLIILVLITKWDDDSDCQSESDLFNKYHQKPYTKRDANNKKIYDALRKKQVKKI